MKKFKIILAITVLATVLVGCPDVTVPAFNITDDISQEVPVAVTANADGTCKDYSETGTFDLKSNAEINENYSKVQSVTVNSITWEVTNYAGDDDVWINSGLLKIGGTSFEIGKVNLKSADTDNEMFILTDGTKLTAVANEIIATGAITVTLETSSGGNCENDFSYTLKITANVKVSVQP